MLRRSSDQYNRGLSVYVPRRVFSVFFVRVVFFRCLLLLSLLAGVEEGSDVRSVRLLGGLGEWSGKVRSD